MKKLFYGCMALILIGVLTYLVILPTHSPDDGDIVEVIITVPPIPEEVKTPPQEKKIIKKKSAPIAQRQSTGPSSQRSRGQHPLGAPIIELDCGGKNSNFGRCPDFVSTYQQYQGAGDAGSSSGDGSSGSGTGAGDSGGADAAGCK